MGLNLIAGPTIEPLTLAETKLHLRVDIDEDNTLIASLISTARRQAELFLRRALVSQTWDLVLDVFPGCDEIHLPLPPLISVTHIKYLTLPDYIDDPEFGQIVNTYTTFDVANYRVYVSNEPGKIKLKYNKAWPGDVLREAEGIQIRFVAGYGATAASVPVNIRQGMLMLIGHWYENREAVVVGTTAVSLPMAVENSWWPDRFFG